MAAYHHTDPETAAQAPDDVVGSYYVSARYSGQHVLLAGPYFRHAEALAAVDGARAEALRVDVRAPWYAYGTCRLPIVHVQPGLLNGRLGSG